MCGVVSEDRFWNAQFVGGENKPRVIAMLYSCDNTGDSSLCNQSGIFVPVISPASDNLHNSGGQRTTILVFGQNFVKDAECVGNVFWIDGLRAYDGSPFFDRLGEQIG